MIVFSIPEIQIAVLKITSPVDRGYKTKFVKKSIDHNNIRRPEVLQNKTPERVCKFLREEIENKRRPDDDSVVANNSTRLAVS